MVTNNYRIRKEINKNLDDTAKKLEMKNIVTEDDSSKALDAELPNNDSIIASDKPSKNVKNLKKNDRGE